MYRPPGFPDHTSVPILFYRHEDVKKLSGPLTVTTSGLQNHKIREDAPFLPLGMGPPPQDDRYRAAENRDCAV